MAKSSTPSTSRSSALWLCGCWRSVALALGGGGVGVFVNPSMAMAVSRRPIRPRVACSCRFVAGSAALKTATKDKLGGMEAVTLAENGEGQKRHRPFPPGGRGDRDLSRRLWLRAGAVGGLGANLVGRVDPATADHSLTGIDHRRLPRCDAIFGGFETDRHCRTITPAARRA